MKLSIKFHPLLLQASLAAGGVALMAFNYLQFAIPHGKGLITLSQIPWKTLTTGQLALYGPLVLSGTGRRRLRGAQCQNPPDGSCTSCPLIRALVVALM